MSDFDPVESEVLESSSNNIETKINWELYQKLKYLGIIHEGVGEIDIRSYNIGNSNYSKHIIQPWSIWLDYQNLLVGIMTLLKEYFVLNKENLVKWIILK